MGWLPDGLGLVVGGRIENLQDATPTKQRDAGKCHPVRLAVGPAAFIRMGSPIGAWPRDMVRRASTWIPSAETWNVMRRFWGNGIIVPPRVSPLLSSDAQAPWGPSARRHALDVHQCRTGRAPGGRTQYHEPREAPCATESLPVVPIPGTSQPRSRTCARQRRSSRRMDAT
jgi:hypothetical protein